MFINTFCLAIIQITDWIERFWHYANYGIPIGNFKVSVISLITGVIIFYLALIASRVLQSYLQNRLNETARIDPGIRYTLFRIANYVLLALGVLFGLRAAFGLDLTTLAVVFTAMSVGIGFGLQYIAGDLASGFILLFERPVKTGDFVTVKTDANGEVQGRVHSINLRTTIILTNQRTAVILPNSKLVNQSFANWSFGDRKTAIQIDVSVDYDSDVDLVTETLLRATEGVKFVLDEPKPEVRFMKFGETTLDFRLLVWTNQPRNHVKIRSDINYKINRLFIEEDIKMPPPRGQNVYNDSSRFGGRKEAGLVA